MNIQDKCVDRNSVINMNNFRTRPVAGNNIPTKLNECREIMTGHLKQSLPIMMDEVDDVLLDIAIKTTNSQERTKYFNAMYELRQNRDNIAQKFIENFSILFSQNLRPENAATENSEEAQDIDNLAMTNAVNKIRNNCHQTLLILDERMSRVLKTNDLDASRNPVSPEVVCQAFCHACDLFDSETEIRLIIFKYFEKNVSGFLNDVYSEIDNIFETDRLTRESDIGDQQTSTNSTKDYQKVADVKQAATSEIQNLLEDKDVPDFVSDFLYKNWVKLLTKILNKNGTNSDSWQHAIDTVEDLVWCVGNLSSKNDRDKFDKLWPDLLIRLQNGINMISMSRGEETQFISKLSKHRAALTLLGALSKSKGNEATKIRPEKIKALRMKIKSAAVKPVDKGMGLDSTLSENDTMPSLRTYASKRQNMDGQLVLSDGKKIDFDSIGSEDITIPILETKAYKPPFMDELLVDNHNIDGCKFDLDEN